MTRNPLPLSLLVLGISPRVAARTWVDFIDTTIYAPALVDPNKEMMKKWGLDNTLHPAESTEPKASDVATSTPVAQIVQAPTPTTQIPTNIPTAEPTRFPTISPSAMPSEGLITCEDELSYPHIIRMHDSWGDGWSGATLRITSMLSSIYTELPGHRLIFEGGLRDGYDSHSYVCLQPQVCYDVEVDGEGQWLQEIKWDIRTILDKKDIDDQILNEMSTLAKGKAPASCKFSIPERDTGEMVCPFQCLTTSPSPTVSPTLSPVKVVPTRAPSTLSPTEATVPSRVAASETGYPTSLVSNTNGPTSLAPTVDVADLSKTPTPEASVASVAPTPNVSYLASDMELILKEPYSPLNFASPVPTPANSSVPSLILASPVPTPAHTGVPSLLDDASQDSKAGSITTGISDYPSLVPSVGESTLLPTDGHIKLDGALSFASSSSVPKVRPPPTMSPTVEGHHNAFSSFFSKFQQLQEQQQQLATSDGEEDGQLPSDFPSLTPSAASI